MGRRKRGVRESQSICLFDLRTDIPLVSFSVPGGRERQLCRIKAFGQPAAVRHSPLQDHPGSRGQDGTRLREYGFPRTREMQETL